MRTAAALALCMILASCGLAGPTAVTTPGAGATSTPIQAASAPRITPPPVTPPTPPGTNLPAFTCAAAGGGSSGSANVTGIRISEQIGYDRFVIQFDSKVPTYTVKRQSKPVYKAGGSGQAITLSGVSGALVQVHSATEAGTYSGPTDLTRPDLLVLNEARLTEDFEGYVAWGFGLSRATCLRTFTLSDPPRLVIDFRTTAS
jgi:hypothetical protein